MDHMVLMGIDLGTSGLKVALFDPDGTRLASVSRELPLLCRHQGWAEQDPDHWWAVLRELMPELRDKAPQALNNLAMIAVTGQQSSPVLLNREGRVLTNSPIWMDRRTALECRELEERFGGAALYEATGLRPDPMYTVYKLMWLKKHEPEVWRETALVMQPKDFINYRLTGLAATDYGSAAATQVFDLQALAWHRGLLAAADIEPSLFSEPGFSSQVLGTVREELSAAWGWPRGVPVVIGGGDTTVSALGCGVRQPGDTAIVIGTSSDVVTCVEKPVIDPQRRIGCYPYSLPGMFMTIAGSNSSGAILNWCRDTFFAAEKAEAAQAGLSVFDLMLEGAAKLPIGAEGLICLPYFSGERSPIFNPEAKGLISGFSLMHTRSHLVRALVEGITLSIYDRLKVAEDLNLPMDRILLTGGGAKNDFWRQMITDAIGRPTYCTEAQEAAGLGAAMLAATGAGIYPTVRDACEAMAPAVRETRPDPEHRGAYGQLYLRFKDLYARNRDFYANI